MFIIIFLFYQFFQHIQFIDIPLTDFQIMKNDWKYQKQTNNKRKKKRE